MNKKQITPEQRKQIQAELIEYKETLLKHNIKGSEIAKQIGMKYGSYKSATKTTVDVVPKWVKAFNIANALKNK